MTGTLKAFSGETLLCTTENVTWAEYMNELGYNDNPLITHYSWEA